MSKLDLTLYAGEANIRTSAHGLVLELSNLDRDEFDTEEVAQCVGVQTFIDAIGSDAILNYMGTDALCDYLKIDRI